MPYEYPICARMDQFSTTVFSANFSTVLRNDGPFVHNLAEAQMCRIRPDENLRKRNSKPRKKIARMLIILDSRLTKRSLLMRC